MAEKGPPAPTPKPARKPATQVNVKEPYQENTKTPQSLLLHWNQE